MNPHSCVLSVIVVLAAVAAGGLGLVLLVIALLA